MDAVAAVGLASGILSFITFSSKVVSGAVKIYESIDGVLDDDRSRAAVVEQLQSLTARISSTCSSYSYALDEQDGLAKLVKECTLLSERLIALLEKPKPKRLNSRSQSLWAALRSAAHESEKKAVETLLGNCRAQLEIHLVQLSSRETKESLAMLINSSKSDESKLDSVRVSMDQLRASTEAAVKTCNLNTETLDRIFKLCHDILVVPAQQQILECLKFESINDRYYGVSATHRNTFSWIYEHEVGDQGTNCKKSDRYGAYDDERNSWVPLSTSNEATLLRNKACDLFTSWLRDGDGIFHISGKLGSGKSTLMKYLSDHTSTKQLLEEWAGKKKLVFVRFFFWKPGTPLQKSVPGLYRTLLHEVLRQCPELIASVFPSAWNTVNQDPWQFAARFEITENEIISAFDNIVDHMKNGDTYQDHRFCFFIDGLDEYEPSSNVDHKAMVELLQSWTGAHLCPGNVKLCVSSREHNVYMNAFSAQKRLRLHGLTRLDLEDYVADKLAHISRCAGFYSLVRGVVSRADGIFQWAVTVVRNIRDEIETMGDLVDVKRLLEHLNCLPDEIDELYRHLLGTLPPISRQRAYRSLELVSFASKHELLITPEAYSFFEDFEKNNQCIMSKSFFETAMRRTLALDRLEVGQRLLRGWCGGLLESKIANYGDGDDISRARSALCFTHRSVSDFLERCKLERLDVSKWLKEFDSLEASSQLLLADLQIFGKQSTAFAKLVVLLQLRQQNGMETSPYRFLEAMEAAIPKPDFMFNVPNDPHRSISFDLGFHSGPGESTVTHIGVWHGSASPNGTYEEAHFMASPFYLEALEIDFEYPKWKVRNDPTTLDSHHKRAILLFILSGRLATPREIRDESLYEILDLMLEQENLLAPNFTCSTAGDMLYAVRSHMGVWGRKDAASEPCHLNLWQTLLFQICFSVAHKSMFVSSVDITAAARLLTWFLQRGADPNLSLIVAHGRQENGASRKQYFADINVHFGFPDSPKGVGSLKPCLAVVEIRGPVSEKNWKEGFRVEFPSMTAVIEAAGIRDDDLRQEILQLLPGEDQIGMEVAAPSDGGEHVATPTEGVSSKEAEPSEDETTTHDVVSEIPQPQRSVEPLAMVHIGAVIFAISISLFWLNPAIAKAAA